MALTRPPQKRLNFERKPPVRFAHAFYARQYYYTFCFRIFIVCRIALYRKAYIERTCLFSPSEWLCSACLVCAGSLGLLACFTCSASSDLCWKQDKKNRIFTTLTMLWWTFMTFCERVNICVLLRRTGRAFHRQKNTETQAASANLGSTKENDPFYAVLHVCAAIVGHLYCLSILLLLCSSFRKYSPCSKQSETFYGCLPQPIVFCLHSPLSLAPSHYLFCWDKKKWTRA